MGEPKHTLSQAMQHFQNTVTNPSKSSDKAVIAMAAVSNAQTQAGAQPGTAHSRIITKTIKFCNHCRKDYHVESECREKYPHLVNQDSQRKSNKRRRNSKSQGQSQKPTGNNDSTKGAFCAYMATADITKISKLWICDSGTSQHITHDRSIFTSFKTSDCPPIQGIGGVLIPKGIGNVMLRCAGNEGLREFPLFDVLYVPDGGLNLISQGQLQRDGCPLKIVPEGIEIGNYGIIARRQDNNLYILNMWNVSEAALALAAINSEAIKMWHARLGHLGNQNILKLAGMSKGMDLTKPPPQDACPPCAIAQSQVEPHRAPIQPGKHPLDLIHSDVQGPFPEALNGAKYMVTFLCDFDKRSHVTLLRVKSGVLQAFKNYKKQNEYGDKRIKRLRSDCGGEYDSKDFENFRNEHGIQWEPTVPGNPPMNGTAERLGQTLHKLASTMREGAKVDIKYWAEMVLTANYLRNRQPTAGRSITPYESHTGSPPELGHLRIIGQTGYAQNRKPSTGWKKFQERATKCTLVGYEGDHIYRMINPRGAVMRYSNVQWIDNNPPSPPSLSFSQTKRALHVGQSGPPTRKQKITHHTDSPHTDLVDAHESIESIPTGPLPSNAGKEALANQLPIEPWSQADILSKHPKLRAPSPDPLALLALLARANDPEPYEPKTYKQAVDSREEKDWRRAMQEEIDSINENDTWILTSLPPDRKALRGKWVYKIKRGPAGEILRYKARWVVRGFEQREGIDYNETFASVVKPMSYKAIFAIAAANDWEIHHMDVKTAFLYGRVDEEIYVEQPTGLDDGSTRVCKLKKALYGLKQSSRIWYETITTFFKSHEFVPVNADLSVFVKEGVIVAIYVDDLIITGSSSSEIQRVKKLLSDEFSMVDLGPINYYLGMTITRDRANRILRLGQQAYLEKVLRDHGMWDTNPVATPMDGRLEAAPEGHQATDDSRLRYQSAVGSLMYAMLGIRPDLAFAVSVVSRYASNPTDTHWKAVKRIFRYIKGTLPLQLTYKGHLQLLNGYTDADWAGDHHTRRSTSGFVFNVGSGAISWSSKRQPTVALSSCEAEYMGQTQATKEAVWLSSLLDQLSAPQVPGNHSLQTQSTSVALACLPTSFALNAIIIHCDNQGAIALAKNPQAHARSKHIDIQWHYQREKIEDKSVEFRYVPTEEQVADGLTKALLKDKFVVFRKALGLE